MDTLRNKIVWIGLAILMIVTLVFAVIAPNVTKLMMSEEDRLAMTYPQFTDADKKVEGCENVEFLAYFTRDLNKDGIAEKLGGTSKDMSSTDMLYLELNVISDGTLEDGAITFSEGNNYKVELKNLLKDGFFAQNYIDVKDANEILLDNVNAGTQRLIVSTIVPNVKKDGSNFTKDSKVTLTGTHVSSDGTVRTPINKEITLTVDWYGTTKAYIDAPSRTIYRPIIQEDEEYARDDFGVDTLPDYTAAPFTVEIKTGDKAEQLPLIGTTTTVKVPRLNGYYPEYVNVSGGTYDEETHTVTFSNSRNPATKSTYSFVIKYPLAAYKWCFYGNNHEWMEDAKAEFLFEINTSYSGQNNPNYTNPYTSYASSKLSVIINLDRGGPKPIEIVKRNVDFHKDLYVKSSNGSRYFDGNKLLSAYDNEEEKYFYYVVDYNIENGKSESQAITIHNIEQDKLGAKSLELYETDCFIFMNQNDHLYALGEEGTVDVYGVEYVNEMDPLTPIMGHSLENARYQHAGDLSYGKRVLNNTSRDSTFVQVYLDDYFGKKFTNDIFNELRYSEWDFIITGEDYGNIVNGDISPTWVKIETSPMKPHSNMTISVVKRLNMDLVRNAFTREEILNAGTMRTYMDNDMGASIQLAFVKSEANINWYDSSKIETQNVDNPVINRTFTINTSYSDDLLYSKWKDGEFVAVLPSEFANVEVKEVTGNNVNVTGWTLNKDKTNNRYYLKILTENDAEVKQESITVNIDIVPDARSRTKTSLLELYYYNPNNDKYYNTAVDIYDANNNGSKSDRVGYAKCSTAITASETLITVQTVSDYDDLGSITVAPNSAELSKETRSANLNISVANNYKALVTGTKLLGRVPYEGNKYVLIDREIGSDFTAAMTGPIVVPDSIKDKTTVYYSEAGEPGKDVTDAANGWKTADEITDWSKIKSYLIDMSAVTLYSGYEYEFYYPVTIPEGLNYNDSSYATHAVEYDYNSPNGTIHLETEPTKVGLKIARLYNLTGIKFKEGKDLKVKGAIYSLEELNSIGDVVKKTALISDSNGNFSAQGIYVNATYRVRETSAPQDYLLNDKVYEFRVKEKDDGTLEFEYISNNHFRAEAVSKDAEENDIVYIEIEDEPKYQLNVTYVDKNTGRPLYSVVTRLDGKLNYTDENGKLSYSRLIQGTEYELQEVQVKGNTKQNYTFKLDRSGDTYVATLDDGMTLESIENNDENHLIQLNVRIEKESNPTYTLEIVKVEKDASKKDLSSMKKVQGAVFSLERVDDNEFEDNLTTNENGLAIAEGLYQYVENKPITGKYILQEITAPEGYIENTEEIGFVVTKENDGLKVEIENRDSLTSIKDVIVEEGKVILVIQDTAYFKLIKTDSETGALLPNAKFVIYELDNDGNVVDCGKDVYGNYVGEQDPGSDEDSPYYVYTNESGEITVPLRDGKYKIEEVEAPRGYTGAGVQTFELNNQTDAISTEVEYTLNESNIEDTYVEPERTETLEIQYIEDLLALAADMVENDNNYSDTKVILKNDLDFNDPSSYRNSESIDYGDLNGNEEVESLLTELTTGIGFKPIGLYYDSYWKFKPFSGTFDGQNHEIKNIKQGYESSGLFALLRNAVVKNLKISGSVAGNYSGSIASRAIEDVYLENCENNANVSGSYAGGLIGYIDITQLTSAEKSALTQSCEFRIINCTNNGTIGGNYAGGFVGYFYGSDSSSIKTYNSLWVKNCTNNGNISKTQYSGGMIGYLYDYNIPTVQVIDCTNNAEAGSAMIGWMYANGTGFSNIKFKNIKNTGDVFFVISNQIQGYNASGLWEFINCKNEAEHGVFFDRLYSYNYDVNVKFYNCINKGAYNGGTSSQSNIGGFVGYYDMKSDYLDIVNCSNEGNIVGQSYVGGFIGSIGGSYTNKVRIYNSSNKGDVLGGTSAYGIAGFIGSPYNTNSLEIKNSYNTGKISGSGAVAGLIGDISKSSSVNTFENCYNEGDIVSLNYSAKLGGLVGSIRTNGTTYQFDNCYNKGNLYNEEGTAYCYAGGIIAEAYTGRDNSYIKNCYNLGNITNNVASDYTSYEYSAGIIGYGSAKLIENCYNKGNIVSKNPGASDAGGIAGYQYDSTQDTMRNCTNYGKINVASGYVGGISGYGYSVRDMENCFNYGNITMISPDGAPTSTGSKQIGGIVGYGYGNIKNCFNKADILLESASRAGGIAGQCSNNNNNAIECCYNTGDIICLSTEYYECCAGGIAGYAYGVFIRDCYNEGDVTGGHQVGGIVGYNNSQNQITNVYNLGNVTSLNAQSKKPYSNYIGAITAFGFNWDSVYNEETGEYEQIKNYNVIADDANAFYLDSIELNSATVDTTGTPVSYDYMKSMEFYTKLNSNGVWYIRNNLPPTLMMKTPVYGEATEINITNDKDDYFISTRIDGNKEGGTISGSDTVIYETVEAGENNTKVIEVEAAEDYSITNLTVNNKKIDFASKMVGSKVVLEAGYFNEMDENKLVAVTFAKKPIEIQKVDEDTNEPLTGAKFKIWDYSEEWGVDANANAIGDVTRCEGSTYYFVQDSTGAWVSNNKARKGTSANSYVPIDLTNYKGTYTLNIGYYVKAYWNDYGYLTITDSPVAPLHTDVSGRLVHSNNYTSSYGTRTTLEGGKVYYLHMGFTKSSSGSNQYDDCMKVTSITLTMTNEGNLEQEYIVDSTGKIVIDTVTDKLWIKEIEAPEGYKLDDTTHEYDVSSINSIVFTNKIDDTAGQVTAHYYLIENGVTTTEKVAEDEIKTGKLGESYRTDAKELPGLKLNTTVFPENAIGTFTAEPIEVNYYYDVEDFDLTIHHYKEGTTEKLVEDEVIKTTPEIEVENNTYTLGLNQEYVLRNNSNYLTLIADDYNFVDVYSDVENNLTIDNTLHYDRTAQLTYTYDDKVFDIMTRVKNHVEIRPDELTGDEIRVEVAGGTISGQDEAVYEEVVSKENATKDIIITPDSGYEISLVQIKSTDENGTETTKVLYGEGAEECEVTYSIEEGVMTLTKFQNVQADKEVKVEFIPQETRAIVHHIIVGTTEDYSTETKEGRIGDHYTTSPITIDGYEVVANTPNTSGYLTQDIIHVYYYYEPVNCKIIIKYVDINSNEEIDKVEEVGKFGTNLDLRNYVKEINGYVLRESPEETVVTYTIEDQTYTFKYAKVATVRAIYVAQGTTSPKLAEDEVIEGYEGKEYTTSAKTIEKYVLVEVPTNASGTMVVTDESSETLVVYEYVKKPTKVVVNYVDVNTDVLVDQDEIDGKVDDPYTVTATIPSGYVLVENDAEGNSILPTNTSGTMTEETIEVTYYVAREATVRAIYVAQGTTSPALAEEVVIEGYEGKAYTTSAKTIEKYVLVEVPTNASGTMVVTNESSETLVVYEYVKKPTKVVVNYVDVNDDSVVDSEEIPGRIDDPYTVTANVPSGYVLVEEDAEGNSILPTNASGTMTEETIEVTYYVAREATVRAIYVAQGTTSPALAEEVVIEGYEGKAYTTSAKTIEKYVLVEVPTNASGTMVVTDESSETLVVYEYVKKPTKVVVNYVDVNDDSVVDSEEIPGRIDDPYTVTANVPSGYVLVEEDGEGNSILPTNASGTMTEETIEVTYYVAREATVRAIYVEEGTTSPALAEDVVIEGYEGKAYTTSAKTIANYTLKATPTNATGTMNVTDESSETLVVYEYIKNSSNVIEKYVDINTDDIVDSINHPGHVGDEYEITPNAPEGYVIMEEDGEGNSILPTNAKGEMGEDTIEVIYKVARIMNVRAIYVKEGTETKLAEDVVIEGYEGKAYTTSAKTIEEYELVATPANAEGTMRYVDNTEVIVKYEYRKLTPIVDESTKVVEKYVDINTEEVVKSTDHEGQVGDEYKITPNVPEGYVLVEEDKNGNNVLPTNQEGRMTEEVIEVVYKVAKEAKVTVKYVTETGEKVEDDIVIPGYEGKPYKTEEKEINGYRLVEVIGEPEGDMEAGDQVVTYRYEKEEEPAKVAYVRVIYIDTDTKEKIAEDTVIEGYEGKPYTTTAKEIKDYEILIIPTNAKGVMTITEDGEGNIINEIVVKYIYKKNKATKVVEKYVDINSKETVEEKDHEGKVGDSYEVTPNVPKGYKLMEKDKDGKDIIPTNTKGRMTEEVIEVVYYVAKDAKVKAKYVVKYGGKDIADEEEIPGYEGKEYSVDPKDIDGYELIEIDGKPEGTMKPGENVVTFYYAKKATGIIPQTGINGIKIFLYAMFAIVVIAGVNGTVYVVYRRK